MRTLILLALVVLGSVALEARTLIIPTEFGNLEEAVTEVSPGDTILYRSGMYPGGEHVVGLQGTPDAWITIRAEVPNSVRISGGGNAWQLTDPAYLRIEGFLFVGQTGNGINIDDGGTYETPAHHVIFDRCAWRALAVSGNNDQLKLSGLDSFVVRNCSFEDGADGGSAIDMVGCHYGVFEQNTFTRGGSNSIQAKGGTRFIRIERNTFMNGGLRAINIGGSTGLEFFRPLDVKYESSDIAVYSNVFVGAEAPIAFVGTVNSEVVNNTFIFPEKWTMRILQETTAPGFIECGDNAFRNNIVIVSDASDSPTVNEGDNTRGETFLFTNNLWYHFTNPSWEGPNLPAPESNGIVGGDPYLETDSGLVIRPGEGSPAIGAGADVARPTHDYFGRPFLSPRSIGAVEVISTSGTHVDGVSAIASVVHDGAQLVITYPSQLAHDASITLYDVAGRRVAAATSAAGASRATMPIGDNARGIFLLMLEIDGRMTCIPVRIG